ncbi:MAG TPA: hypothetical protein VIV11_40205 [Kofleriaceae bacterium]
MIADALVIAAEHLGDDAPRVLARLRGFGTPAQRPRSAVLAAVRAPVPLGLRHVDPSWIESALAALPVRTRTALTECNDPVDVWLARWATATLPPITEPRDGLAWLTGIGTDQMAFALGEAARAMPALRAACARIAKPPRVGELGPKRAAIERCRDVSLDDDFAIVRVACRALAPHLAADQLAKLQLIRSLPRPLGLVVSRELALHAATSFDQCPSWAALTAH